LLTSIVAGIVVFVIPTIFIRHFQQYFSYIVVVTFIGGGNRRKSPTCRKSLTNFIICCCIEYTSPFGIRTDCTGSCKSKYHMITTTTAPKGIKNGNKALREQYFQCFVSFHSSSKLVP
jgi:hypothetical protein